MSLNRKILFIISFFIGILLISVKQAAAQTCSYETDIECNTYDTNGDGIADVCDITTQWETVGCTPQGANSCPGGQSGQACNYSGYIDTIRSCNWGAQGYICNNPVNNNMPAGYCGCNPGSGGTDGGSTGTPPPPPPSCNCGACNWSCYQSDQSSSSVECASNSACDDGDPDSVGFACRSNCCNSCNPPQCSCTPSCTPPSALAVNSPAVGATIQPGSTITWSVGNWGLDSSASACSNNACNYQSYSGQGQYRLSIGGVNITSRCAGHQGSGASAYLTTNQCTFTSYDPAWPGTATNIVVTASNNCGSVQTSRTFNWAPNQKPFCTGIVPTSLQGRWAPNSIYGVRDAENFSLTVTGGETDAYGSPRFMQLCYAIRNQPTSFYQNGAAFRCIGQSTNSNSYTVNLTFNQMKADYNPTVSYSGTVDQHGFVVVTNVGDNVTNNLCSTNIGYRNGLGIYYPPYLTDSTQTCNGGSCVLNIHNTDPEFQSMSGPTGWIGTEPDSDNGVACVDNNPATYTALVSDADRSSDIDRIDLMVATSAQLADANNDNVLDNPDLERNYPLRVIFAKKWSADGNQEFANGTFFVRDTRVTSNSASGVSCYRQNGSTQPIDPTGWNTSNPNISRNARWNGTYSVWCFGVDGHSFDDVPLVQNLDLNGVAVDVYYLRADISVYSEGYRAALVGGTDQSQWQNYSYVAYERNGNRVWTQFKVRYLKDGTTDRWGGQYRNAWYVSDILGGEDNSENTPGSYMAATQWGNKMHIVGDTRIDLTAPTISVDPPSPATATRLNVRWTSQDSRSGLSRVRGEANTNINPPAGPLLYNGTVSYNMSGNGTPPTAPTLLAPYLWDKSVSGTSSQSQTEVVDIGNNEQGNISFYAYSQDNACNYGTSSGQVNLNLPWIQTRGGSLYTQGSPLIDVKNLGTSNYPNSDPISPAFSTAPFNINKWESGVSSELLSSGSTINKNSNLPNRSLTGAYSLENYSDNNNRAWYTTIKNEVDSEYALKPGAYNHITSLPASLGGNISALSSGGINCSDSNKICLVEVPSVAISNSATPLICDRKTIFLVSGNITINADITASGATNGCLFISSGNVVIQPGSYKSGSSTYPLYDQIDAFIITDGTIHIQEDSAGAGYRDGLKVRGSLLAFGLPTPPLAGSIQIDRSLKLLDNLNYPSLVIQHDPRYYSLAEEIMGGTAETYKREIGYK